MIGQKSAIHVFFVIFSKASFGCIGEEMERGKAQHYMSDPQPPVG